MTNKSISNPHYLAIGALIYALVSALWLTIVFFFSDLQNNFIFLFALFLLLLLVIIAFRTLQKALQFAPISSGSPELGQWFGIIFAAEGIGIGVGSGILVALDLSSWIAPWVAFLVGLHFFPLGYLLKLPLDYLLGAAILILTCTTILFAPADEWVLIIGLGTSFLLWLAGWGRIYHAQRNIS